MKTAKKIVWEVTQRLFPGFGCGDGGCVFGHPGGMQTNGGCNCIKEEKIMLRRNLMALSQVAQTLAAVNGEPEEK